MKSVVTILLTIFFSLAIFASKTNLETGDPNIVFDTTMFDANYPQMREWIKAGVEGGIPFVEDLKIKKSITPTNSDGILSAINSVANSGGGAILLKKGKYTIDKMISMRANVSLIGEDRDGVICEITMNDKSAFYFGSGDVNCGLYNLTIQGSWGKPKFDWNIGPEDSTAEMPNNSNISVKFSHTKNCWLDNVKILNSANFPMRCSASHITFRNVYVDGVFNKQGGCHGYFIIQGDHNLVTKCFITHLRHISLQGSGVRYNVLYDNDFEQEVSFHSGDDGDNLIENNRIHIPSDMPNNNPSYEPDYYSIMGPWSIQHTLSTRPNYIYKNDIIEYNHNGIKPWSDPNIVYYGPHYVKPDDPRTNFTPYNKPQPKSKTLYPIKLTSTNSEFIKFDSTYNNIVSNSKITFRIYYNVTQKSDIVVALFNPDNRWIGSKKITTEGTNTQYFTIDLGKYTPTPRKNYKIIASIRTVGGDYTTIRKSSTIYVDFLPNIETTTLPPAPQDKKWVAIPELTDEFNGNSLDSKKWINYHPYWNGREPSQYKKDNVKVENGMLQLKSDLKDSSKTGNWVNSACVTSKERSVIVGGYYEACIRGSDISMTSAFWMQGKNTEIDVIENFGNTTKTGDYYVNQRSQMLSNTHSFGNGWDNDKTTPVHADIGCESNERFIRYGVWYKSPDSVIFYLNGKEVNRIKPGQKFNENMYMFFDTETFQWQGFPTIQELTDPDKNIMYVDWVHSYKLVDSSTATKIAQKNSNNILIYPNPVGDFIIVNSKLKGNLHIYDILGNKVKDLKKGKNLINIDSGIYFVVLEDNNRLVAVKQFYKNR